MLHVCNCVFHSVGLTFCGRGLFSNPPPPHKTRTYMGMGFLKCQAPIKLALPFPAPESRVEKIKDTRLFLNKTSAPLAPVSSQQGLPRFNCWGQVCLSWSLSPCTLKHVVIPLNSFRSCPDLLLKSSSLAIPLQNADDILL